MAWVKVLESVEHGKKGEWRLCFQKVVYNYDNKETEDGFRFIWKTSEDRLQPARGQARIPNSSWLFSLLEKARAAGWFLMPKQL